LTGCIGDDKKKEELQILRNKLNMTLKELNVTKAELNRTNKELEIYIKEVKKQLNETYELQSQIEKLREQNKLLKDSLNESQRKVEESYELFSKALHLIYNKSELVNIDQPYKGVYSPKKYVEVMAELAANAAKSSEIVKNFADITRIGNYTYNTKVLAFFNSEIVRIKYITDEKQYGRLDFLPNPDYFLTNGLKGDCEDYATAMAAVLVKKGYRVWVVAGWLNERPHAWIEVQIGNEMYIGDLGFKGADGRYYYMFVKHDDAKGYKEGARKEVIL